LTDQHEKNPDYVARGLKAAIHNPNVSSEAKYHAAQQLEEMGVKPDDADVLKPSVEEHLRQVLHSKTDEHEKNPDYVARGLKAAIHNPNVSAEAKDHAAQQLEEMGGKTSDSDAQKQSDEEHARHQLGKQINHLEWQISGI
jgi:translation elongation factor EF-1beta